MPDDTDEGKDREGTPEAAPSFETWYTKLAPADKTLLDEHVSALKNAHERQKETNRELRDKLKGMSGMKDEEVKNRLQELSNSLDAAQRRANFFETLPRQIRNPVAAWAIAQSDDTILTKDGRLDVERFKKQYPELVQEGSSSSPAARGSGTIGGGGAVKGGTAAMNQFIRASAGRTNV